MTVLNPGKSISEQARLFSVILFVIVLVGVASVTPAQGQDEVIKTETSLVQLNVGVVDRQGQAITSLGKNDFVVYEDNVQRPIVSFEPMV